MDNEITISKLDETDAKNFPGEQRATLAKVLTKRPKNMGLDELTGLLLIAYMSAAKEFINKHDPKCSGCPGMRLHQTVLVKAQAVIDENMK